MGTTGNSLFEAGLTSNAVTHTDFEFDFAAAFAGTPAFFANMQTYDGADTATVRYRILDSDGVKIFLEEERSRDPEIAHTTEMVGTLAIQYGDILARDRGGPQSPVQPLFPGVSGFSLQPNRSSDARLWEAVRIQQSWEEMTLSINHHDEYDHDDHHTITMIMIMMSSAKAAIWH